MRIAVNTRFLLKDKLEGIGVFTNEVLKRLVAAHPEHEFIFLFDRAYDADFVYAKNVTPVVIGPQARHPILFYLWFEWAVPAALKKYKADIFFSPDGYLSLRARIPQVQVIHDLAFEHYPDDVPRLAAWHYKHYFPKYAAIAKMVLTVSNYTRIDVLDRYGIQPEKIQVVYNGAKTDFKSLNDGEKKRVKAHFANGDAYFLYVGALHQRKNVLNLLKAFESFKQQGGKGKLLIVGRKAWGNRQMEEFYAKMENANEVVFTGRLSDDDLARVMASARALTYVSYFEGFGIPLLESMQCGVPVITSNVSSMPEVAGNAGILVDPFKPEEIAYAMMQLSTNDALRNELIGACTTQAAKFSWNQTAALVWTAIQNVMS